MPWPRAAGVVASLDDLEVPADPRLAHRLWQHCHDAVGPVLAALSDVGPREAEQP